MNSYTSLAIVDIRRKYDVVFIFIGITLVIIGFSYSIMYAGIPYQDPTDELLKKYNYNNSISETVIIIGFVFIIIGMIGTIFIKIIQTLINRYS